MELYGHPLIHFWHNQYSNWKENRENGYYTAPYDYWNEKGRFPYLIRADGKIAGFALICPHCDYRKEADARCFGEFFVMLKYRRMGIGQQVATQLFDLHRGYWEVCYWKENVSAGLFWKKVVEEYTNEHYHICGTESSHNCGFTFEN